MAKKLDEDVCRWIIEFLLRQQIADFPINKILSVLPIANNNPKFKKLILLRSIQSEISDASVSETILESLETIEALDRQEKTRMTDSMKAAYCAVAVECTVKYLWVSTDRKGKYFDAVKRIWRGKIGNLEKSKETELVSDELMRWRDEIEEAVWDVKVSKKLLEKNTRNDALKLVRVYLGEALALLGPTFLELAARMMKKVMQKEKEKGNDPVWEGLGENFELAAKDKGKDKEIRKDNNVVAKRKHVAVHRRRRGPVKIIDCEDLEEKDDASSSNKYDSLSTPEVSKVQEALKASALELQALVNDPLPDALKMAEAVLSDMARKIANLEPSGQNHQSENDKDANNLLNASNNGNVQHVQADEEANNLPNGSDNGNVEHVQAEKGDRGNQSSGHRNGNVEQLQSEKGDRGNQSSGHQNNVRKPSLMEPNGTARTYEWDDSIDGSPQETSNRMNRIRLPTPKRKAVSPLKKYEVTKFARRRKMKRWSLEEEDALRKAVEKFGQGNWKLMLNANRDVFAERTEVDLKDKWRNMTRY